jgi:hypothetical protein
MPLQFYRDGIYKVLDFKGNTMKTQTFLDSSPFIGIRQVFIISSSYLDNMARDMNENLQKLWKPYCLILVINFPHNIMLQFPK